MAVLEFGQMMPSVYFDTFNPENDVVNRVTIVSPNPICTQYHYLNFESVDLKGSYQCLGGDCCKALGAPVQQYTFPVLVWKNNKEYSFVMWKMYANLYKQLVSIVQGNPDLLKQYDLSVVRVAQGQGSRFQLSFIPTGASFYSELPPEEKQKIKDAVDQFYATAEDYMIHSMSVQEWANNLSLIGYDLYSHTWPQGKPIMNSFQASKAIGQGFGQQRNQYGIPQPNSGYGYQRIGQGFGQPQMGIPQPVGYGQVGAQGMANPVQAPGFVPPQPVNVQRPVAPQAPQPVTPPPVTPQPVTPAPVGSVPVSPAVTQTQAPATNAAELFNEPIDQSELDSLLED